jgi:hypothetical protein
MTGKERTEMEPNTTAIGWKDKNVCCKKNFVEKLDIEIEFSQMDVEKCKNIKETITEVAEEQLINNPVEIRKLQIMEHIIEHIEERRKYVNARNEAEEVLSMRQRNKSSKNTRTPNELE